MKDLLLKKEFILKAIEEIKPNLSQLFPEQIDTFNSLNESVKEESFQNINREDIMYMMIELAKLKQHIIKKLERTA
jgi:flagellar biosynthesis/type III secretory pathway chaperone